MGINDKSYKAAKSPQASTARAMVAVLTARAMMTALTAAAMM